MAGIASWYDKGIEKIRQLSKGHLLLFVTVKFLAGVAIGLLLAIWLPIWTWLIFLVLALVISIPLYAKIWGK
jgi:Flp pilus assembly protein TadB